MSVDQSVAHMVPAHEHTHFEEESVVQSDCNSDTEWDGRKIVSNTHLQPPPSQQQIASGEQPIHFLNARNEDERQHVDIPPEFTQSDLDFSPQQHEENDDSSGSSPVDSGRDDSEDSTEMQVFPSATDQRSEQHSTVNEVVPGHQQTYRAPEENGRVNDNNIPLQPIYPQQEVDSYPAIDDFKRPLVSADKWPPTSGPPDQNCEGYVTAEQMDTTDQSAMDIIQTDGLCVPQQKDLSRGHLVIGVSESAVDIMNPPLVSPDIIMEPNHFLEKGVGIIGESLNPVVSHVHNDSRNRVSFRVRKKTRKHKTHEHCRMYMMEDIPVRDPSNYTECPEAFDGRYILKHMQTNAAHYASFLDIRRGSSQSLKTSIDVILGCIPRKQNRSLTTDGLVHTLFYMEGLLETFEEGLQSTGRYNLAAHVKEGIGELSYIRTSAERARQLSLEFTPQ